MTLGTMGRYDIGEWLQGLFGSVYSFYMDFFRFSFGVCDEDTI